MFDAYRAWVRGLMGEPGVWLRLADGSWRRGGGARLDAHFGLGVIPWGQDAPIRRADARLYRAEQRRTPNEYT